MALETNLNEKRKEKKEKKPYLRPGGLEARLCRTKPAYSSPFYLGRRAEQPVPLHSFLGSAWAGPGAAVTAHAPSLASLMGGTRKSATSSPPCRNQAGHELDLHRIKLDFHRILTQVEVSQPLIS
jgi:hypothetical protein